MQNILDGCTALLRPLFVDGDDDGTVGVAQVTFCFPSHLLSLSFRL